MNIYVGNLSPELTEKELRLEFEAFGEVAYVVIFSEKNARGGQAGGHGFVEMASKSEGVAAIARLSGKPLKSRSIEIVEALPLSDKATARGEPKADPSGGRWKRRSL
ncbi:MAG: hypothetical protein A2147_11610 [Chloroflexi bacterium RBG_16_57_8]|nr:MAG: hypothetical protein A2147_11610 [Chloroflexi bacterium RBG_16_57_8]